MKFEEGCHTFENEEAEIVYCKKGKRIEISWACSYEENKGTFTKILKEAMREADVVFLSEPDEVARHVANKYGFIEKWSGNEAEGMAQNMVWKRSKGRK